VRRGHFAALRPVCPVCREAELAITCVARESGEEIIEGILTCANAACQREYPIIDGIPIVVAAIRAWLAANPLQLLLRDDLSPELESVIGDILGPGSPFDVLRQQVSIYASGHYESDSALALLDRALDPPDGPLIDIGCSVGRTTFALADRFGQLAVGVDLNFAMLRVAVHAMREDRVRYARRRVGIVYDRRDFEAGLPARDLVDFWCCDAAALPFADATFALAASLNVVDIVASPRDAIAECARVVAPGGTALIATPYDWTPTATPVEHWLGGHSQRGPQQGASEPALRALVAEKMEITSEAEVPWTLRLHERSEMMYRVHVVVGSVGRLVG
jgi:SAM-dependent methyltransferase